MSYKFKIECALLIIILWIAFLFRIASITTTPGLSGDESFNGADAIKVLDGVLSIFFTDNFGREPLFIYNIAVFMKLFGTSIFAIRLTSVFYGIFGIVFSYILAKQFRNTEVALLSAALISVSF